MPKNPFFSIVSVCFNNLTGLQKTGHSLRLQSCPDFEWIVVDGGSKDGAVDYLTHSKALWTSEPDAGIYDAMNKGLARASGDYIIFLNAGDRLAGAHTLATLKEFIARQKEAPDFVYGDSIESEVYKAANQLPGNKWRMFTHHQAMIYRRESLHGLRYSLKYKIAGDYDFTMRALEHARNVAYLPLPVCVFESGGLSQKKPALGRGEQFMVRARLKIANPMANISIYLLQSAAWTLRSISPGFYCRGRSSGNKRRGFARI